MLQLALQSLGRPKYQRDVPNGNVNGKATGHAGRWRDEFVTAGKMWTMALCKADTDSDGQSNGLELGDPCCIWKKGDTPAYTSDISLPGNPTSQTSRAMPMCPPSPPPVPPSPPAPPLSPLPATTMLVHGIFMSLAFGLIMPAAALVPRCWRFALMPGRWFSIHRGAMLLGVLLNAVGLILGVLHTAEESTHFSSTHSIIGLALGTVVVLQPVNAFLRPAHSLQDGKSTCTSYPLDKHGESVDGVGASAGKNAGKSAGESESRRMVWHMVHAICGVLAIGLGIWQLISGVSLAGPGHESVSGLYFGGLGVAMLSGGLGLLIASKRRQWLIKDTSNQNL